MILYKNMLNWQQAVGIVTCKGAVNHVQLLHFQGHLEYQISSVPRACLRP